jgi:hypothetical protein
LPAKGLAIPVRASFLGFRILPALAIAYDNRSSQIVLYDDRIATRVLVAREHRYDEIESVDVYQAWKTHNLRLVWRGKTLVFSANVGSEERLAELVRFLVRKGVAASSRANALAHAGGT